MSANVLLVGVSRCPWSWSEAHYFIHKCRNKSAVVTLPKIHFPTIYYIMSFRKTYLHRHQPLGNFFSLWSRMFTSFFFCCDRQNARDYKLSNFFALFIYFSLKISSNLIFPFASFYLVLLTWLKENSLRLASGSATSKDHVFEHFIIFFYISKAIPCCNFFFLLYK